MLQGSEARRLFIVAKSFHLPHMALQRRGHGLFLRHGNRFPEQHLNEEGAARRGAFSLQILLKYFFHIAPPQNRSVTLSFQNPRSHPRRRSQCLVITITGMHGTDVRGRGITMPGDLNPAPALRCDQWPAFGRRRPFAFALPLLPARVYSSSSALQLAACRVLSSRRSSFAILSISACQSATEMAGFILISVPLAR